MISFNPGWSLVIMALGLLPNDSLRAIAQLTNATCLPQYGWMYNSKDQSPCLVAAYVQSVCFGSQYTVPALDPKNYPYDYYPAPSADEANSCECNTVTYSLLSACAWCQNLTYTDWPDWKFYCSTEYLGYPENIPSGTAIPQWAYQNVVVSGSFNATLAQVVGDSPESTATAYSLSVLTNPTGSSTPSLSSPKSNNAGAIVGGIVGGAVGLTAVAAVATWFFIRRHRQVARVHAADDGTVPAATSNVQMGTRSFSFAGSQPPLYDPSDPSTFPTSPTMQAVYSNGHQNLYTRSNLNASQG